MNTLIKGELMIAHRFKIDKQEKELVAKIWMPSFSKEKDRWTCYFQIEGSNDQNQYTAYGGQALDAVFNASSAIRGRIDKLNRRIVSEDRPYETAFPKIVPWVYGLHIHWIICDLINDEVRRQEKRLSRKRLAGGKTR